MSTKRFLINTVIPAKAGIHLFLAAALIYTATAPVFAAVADNSVPASFNFQGRLDEAGVPVNATKSMTFRLYDAVSSGSLLDSNALSVSVSKGLFNAAVTFSTAALSGASTKYIELAIDGTTLSPREPLLAVPYAMIAKNVEQTLSVGTLRFGDGSSMSSAGVGSASNLSTSTDAVIAADSDANGDGAVVLKTGANERFRVTNLGLVGVGTALPTHSLHVAGGVLVTSSLTVSGAVRLANLASCDTIDTDANGLLSCGTDIVASGGGSGGGWAVAEDKVQLAVSTQNVGIGTGNPTRKLHVLGDALVTSSMSVSGLEATGNVRLSTSSTGPGMINFTTSNDDFIGFNHSNQFNSNAQFYFGGGNSSWLGIMLDANSGSTANPWIGFAQGGSQKGYLYYEESDNSLNTVGFNFVTNQGTVTMKGTNPKLIIGDAGAEDTTLFYDGATLDYHMALDDSASDLVIGTGNVAGSNVQMVFTNDGNVGVGTTAPSAKFEIRDADGGAALTVSTTATSGVVGLAVSSYNRVGIGTAEPASNLHVLGSVRLANLTGCDTIDTDVNGLLSCGTDTVASGGSGGGWTVANDKVQLVISTQNVGVGTTNPSYKLHVAGDALVTSSMTISGSGLTGSNRVFEVVPATLTVLAQGRVGIGTTSPAYIIQTKTASDEYSYSHTNGTINMGTYIGSNTGMIGTISNHDFQIYTSNNGVIATFGAGGTTGNVGVGTASPAAKFDLRDTNGGTMLFVSSVTGSNVYSSLVVDSNGYVGIGTNLAQTVYGAARLLVVEGNFPPLIVSTSVTGAYGLTVNPANNVGIGTVSPSAKLHVFDTDGSASALIVSTALASSVVGLEVTGDNNVGVGTQGASARLEVLRTDGIGRAFKVSTSTVFDSGLNVDGGNQVGIGTADAQAALEVVGNLDASVVRLSTTSSGPNGLTVSSNSYVGIGTTQPRSVLDVVSPVSKRTVFRSLASNEGAAIEFDATNIGGGRRFSLASDNENGIGLFRFYDHTKSGYTFLASSKVFQLGGYLDDLNPLISGNIPGRMSLIVDDGIICVDNDGQDCDDASRTKGTVYSVNAAVTGVDLAENYPTQDETLKAGELVSLASALGRQKNSDPLVERANTAYQQEVLGVIATAPGILLGGFGDLELKYETKVGVTLAGRTPVKVSLENGPIAPGDYLTASSKPGYAMKATKAGRVIGIALESFPKKLGAKSETKLFKDLAKDKDALADEDAIVVFVNPHYWVPPQQFFDLTQAQQDQQKQIERLQESLRLLQSELRQMKAEGPKSPTSTGGR